MLRKHQNGYVAAGTQQTRNVSNMHNSAVEWLEEYATNTGDRMPHNQNVLLPYGTRKVSFLLTLSPIELLTQSVFLYSNLVHVL